MIKKKKCIKCLLVKSLEDFYRNRKHKDGRQYSCGECARKYNRDNKDKIKEDQKKHRENNIDKAKKYRKEYLDDNRDRLKEKREDKKDKARERTKKWQEENPERLKKHKELTKRNIRAEAGLSKDEGIFYICKSRGEGYKGIYKIGITENSFKRRSSDSMGQSTYLHNKVELLSQIKTKSYVLIENILKTTLKKFNKHQYKEGWKNMATEWYELPPEEIYKEAVYWEKRIKEIGYKDVIKEVWLK